MAERKHTSIEPTPKELLVTHERLLEILNYDPETGIFRWKISPALRVKIGDVAGSRQSGGYLQFAICRRLYRVHRVAWFYMTGEWPAQDLDHINGIKDDNRFANLRPSTRSQNQHNQRGPRSNNKCGYLGVYAVTTRTGEIRFRALINVDGEKINLGRFDSPEEAHAAYISAKRKYHEFCSV